MAVYARGKNKDQGEPLPVKMARGKEVWKTLRAFKKQFRIDSGDHNYKGCVYVVDADWPDDVHSIKNQKATLATSQDVTNRVRLAKLGDKTEEDLNTDLQ